MKINKILFLAIGFATLQFGILQGVSHTIFIQGGTRSGYQIPARGISNLLLGSTSGENNSMNIGPWIGSWKPAGFHTYNQDTFNMNNPYREIEWYEVDPTTRRQIRHCHVILNGTVEYSSNLYIGPNCSIYVQEARPEGWTQRNIDRTGVAGAAYVNDPM